MAPGIGIGISPVFSRGGGSPGPEPAFDIYFIMLWGQSNNTSRYTASGNLPVEQQGVLAEVYNWAYNSGTPGYQPYQSGVQDSYGDDFIINGQLAIYSNQPGMFAIANSLGHKNYNTYGIPTYFAPFSVGGTGLDAAFTPHTWDPDTANNLYDFALNGSLAAYAACKAANPGKVIKPVLLWIQGENDSLNNLTIANAYGANLQNIIQKSRIDLGAGDLDLANVDWVVTSLRSDIFPYLYAEQVQRGQVTACVAEDNVFFKYMNTDRYPISSDGAHYTPISASFGGVLAALNAGYDLSDDMYKLYNPIIPNGYLQYFGGNLITDGDYHYADFTTHCVMTVLDAPVPIDNYLLLGGGGSGGEGSGTAGGGGGSGQAVRGTSLAVTVGKKAIFIGLGGQIGTAPTGEGMNGGNSTFNSLTALGGGFGGGFNAGINGGNGGNGGGGGSFNGGLTAGAGGTGDFTGGTGGAIAFVGGGGAGAGANGGNSTITAAGDGGAGYTWIDGTTYGGGGGGASGSVLFTAGSGGSGGGGNGQIRNPTGTVATSGTDGLGGGGGGLSAEGDPGDRTTGGRGRVKLRIKFQN